jgi:N-acylmannosamine kinase
MTPAPVLAVDIGGSKIAAALVQGGAILDRSQCATPREDVGAAIVPSVRGLVMPWLERAAAIGVATTGFVADGRVSAVNPATLPLPPGFPIERLLAEAFGRRPVIANDAQAATWGEYSRGAGVGAHSFAFLTVSTGVGGGLVADGRLLTGPRGFAGHLGHVAARPDGPACGCGRRGCVEAIASGSAIAARAGAALRRAVAAPEVLALARDDPACRRIVDEAAAAIAQLCLDLVATLDVERIAVGGGVGLNPLFRDRVAAAVAAAPAVFRAAVVAAALGADAGLVGIAELAASAARG